MTKEDPGVNPAIRGNLRDFSKGQLDEASVSPDPLKQFAEWLGSVLNQGNPYANAMVLSTVDADGQPSSRVMLLRDVSSGGFTFFTNYLSKKGEELKKNNRASLLFFWPEAERQVRVEGKVELLSENESEAYFQTRPLENRVGAWASEQSRVIKNREELDKRYAQALERFKGSVIPRPANWGGYVLKPSLFEFWQGRAGRLHDRLQYRLDGDARRWVLERLMP